MTEGLVAFVSDAYWSRSDCSARPGRSGRAWTVASGPAGTRARQGPRNCFWTP